MFRSLPRHPFALPLAALALLAPGAAFAAEPAASSGGWTTRHAFAVGTLEGEISPETSPQDFALPVSDLGIATDGRAFVADAGAGLLRVARQGWSAGIELPFPPGAPPRRAVSPEDRSAPRFFAVSFSAWTGEAFLIDLASGEVHVHSPEWKRLRGFSVAGFARSPKSIVALKNGELLLHDPGKGKVFRLSAEGVLLAATRTGRPTLAVVPGPGSGGEHGRDLVAFGESTTGGVDLLAVDGYGAEPPRRLGTMSRAREGSDLHVLPHPADPLRFAVVEAGPLPADPPRVTLCRFDARGALSQAAPVELPAPPQRDLVPFHPFRLTGAGELVTFGQPEGERRLQILAHALAWPK